MKGNILAQLVTLAEEHEEKARAIRTTIALLTGPTNGHALAALPGKFAQALRLEEHSNGNGHVPRRQHVALRPFGDSVPGTKRKAVEDAAIALWQQQGGPWHMAEFVKYLRSLKVKTSATYASQILRAGGCVAQGWGATALWPPPAPGAKVTPVNRPSPTPRRAKPSRDSREMRVETNRRTLELWSMFGSHPVERAIIVEKLRDKGATDQQVVQATMAMGSLIRYGYLKQKKGGLVQGKTYVPRYLPFTEEGGESAPA